MLRGSFPAQLQALFFKLKSVVWVSSVLVCSCLPCFSTLPIREIAAMPHIPYVVWCTQTDKAWMDRVIWFMLSPKEICSPCTSLSLVASHLTTDNSDNCLPEVVGVSPPPSFLPSLLSLCSKGQKLVRKDKKYCVEIKAGPHRRHQRWLFLQLNNCTLFCFLTLLLKLKDILLWCWWSSLFLARVYWGKVLMLRP